MLDMNMLRPGVLIRYERSGDIYMLLEPIPASTCGARHGDCAWLLRFCATSNPDGLKYIGSMYAERDISTHYIEVIA